MKKPIRVYEGPCPSCSDGRLNTIGLANFKTKIKGYPFTVPEAVIGECDACGERVFAAEEIKRWEMLFAQSLEAQAAFLQPAQVKTLRERLGLSQHDFGRLIGSNKVSVNHWEKEDRPLPNRMSDLMLRLVLTSVENGSVDVVDVLVEEAKKWGIELSPRREMTHV